MTKNEEFDSSPCPAPEMGLSIPTEQQTPARLVYANFWHRFVAAFVDGLYVMMIALIHHAQPLIPVFGRFGDLRGERHLPDERGPDATASAVFTGGRVGLFRDARIIGNSSHLWGEGDADERCRTFQRANFIWPSDGTLFWQVHFCLDFLPGLPDAALQQKGAGAA